MTINNNTDLNSALGINNDEQEKKSNSAPKVLSIIAKINLVISCILVIPFWVGSYNMIEDMFKIYNDRSSLAFVLSSICVIIYILVAIGSWAFFRTIALIGTTISEMKDNRKTYS